MAGKKHRLFPERLQNIFFSLLTPVVKVLNKAEIHPNSLTVAGFVITCAAAVALFRDNLRTGGLLILLGGLCDSIDGNLARSTGKASRFGAMFDSVIDRYSELIMFLGITVYFIPKKDYFSLGATFLALCGSIMVSYTRARAESLGFEPKSGIMQRAERIVFMGFGALFHPLLFKLSLWLIAVLANITALQRLRDAARQDDTGK